MLAREKIVVSAGGTPGNHAPVYFGPRAAEAEYGCQGANGRSASLPTAGGPGQDIKVRLSYADEKPGLVQVAGESNWTGTKWQVTRDQVLFLDCKGGDGGNGGKGEDGQQGGKGARGRNATKYRDAENGGMGAPGGDGGYGTSGADGADAGNVFVSVSEDDLDLLIALQWDINGGKGGLSGTHGDPGDGGIGGNGGDGCTWTERHGDTVDHRSRPPGASGPQGRPGNRPPTYLAGGKSGKQGSCQIRVVNRDLTESTYPDRYDIRVVSFDILDENRDGVNEPGEHLLVTNIKVQNAVFPSKSGSMPSPGTQGIRVLIHGTPWLEPIESEPLELPRSIPRGATVDVPGTLRALIRNETAPRALGQPLMVNEVVTLIADFPRLHRAIPEFSGSTHIVIQYPLQLNPPNCLDCVALGDRVKFSWVLRNISTKPYGASGVLKRHCGTRFSDPGGIFVLSYAEADSPHEANDPLEILDPGAEVTIDQSFEVSNDVLPYSAGQLTLQLMLSDPCNGGMRPVMIYGINMQISGAYKYDPLSQFLLVVNSFTPNNAIHKIINFVRYGLGLHVDIFNLSVSGSYIDKNTGQNVLNAYGGKSIIIFGNDFVYFGLGPRSPWELLDPWEACKLAKGGTSFLFASVGDLNKLKLWGSTATFPAYAFNSNVSAPGDIRNKQSLDEINKDVRSADQTLLTTFLPTHTVPCKKKFLRSEDASLDSAVKSIAKKLNKNIPLHRYVVTSDEAARTGAIAGTIVIREGLPKSAKMFASLLPFGTDTGDIMDYHMYMIVASLPFKMRSRMFWNLAGAMDPAGVSANVLYEGDELVQFKSSLSVSTQRVIPQKVCRAVCLSIESDLGVEVSRFCAKAPWPDKIPTSSSLTQLPLLKQFLNPSSGSTPTLNSLDNTDFLITTLGTLLGALLPIGLGQWFSHKVIRVGNRKAKLWPQVVSHIKGSLSQRFTPEIASQIEKAAVQAAANIKTEIKQAKGPKDLTPVIRARLAMLTQINGADSCDLTGLSLWSESWPKGVIQAKWNEHAQFLARRDKDEEHSRRLLREMVNAEEENE
ncbi:hypothetical protein GP486_001878 [Trichoglossum hirsutum]|uniref:DUF7932 domain-containing protein n=1 Tax=Trichoglossum hirsutum TaxID=265104 RepID=A0A9P8LG01_9PEZI|nr:hypothetical protein GP486_001878 [Trichoglossum hirsutum]